MIQRLREEKLELSLRSVESVGSVEDGGAKMEEREGKRGGIVRMRRNFVKRDGEKLFCFGSDSLITVELPYLFFSLLCACCHGIQTLCLPLRAGAVKKRDSDLGESPRGSASTVREPSDS